MRKISTVFLYVYVGYLSVYAEKINLKGEVQDEFGRPLTEIVITVNREATTFPSNQFQLTIEEGDTLHFEAGGALLKDTVLAKGESYHVVRLKLATDDTDGYYASFPPEFADKKFMVEEFIRRNQLYPPNALKDSISGVVHVRFTLKGNGERDHYFVCPSVNTLLDKEAIRLVKLMPVMIPKLKDNRYQTSNAFIPVRFSTDDYNKMHGKSGVDTKDVLENDNDIKPKNLRMPEYPGGMEKMLKFLTTKLVYPRDAIQRHVSSLVKLRFVVDENGNIVDISIVQSAYPTLDEEAIRVVKLMPRWTPASTPDGKTYRVGYTLPVSFKIIK